MYIVNTSFFVSHDAHDRWVGLMKEKYIPFLAAGGCGETRFYRVLAETASPEGSTYCLMVRCPDMDVYRKLTGELFDEYKTAALPMFGDSVQWFTTLLKEA
ncbi:MAG: DUF4286 family protein [Alistipes sp.]|nr:DUF4286 family protein [Alistipes sp.]